MLDQFCLSGINSTWLRCFIFLFVSTVSWEFFLCVCGQLLLLLVALTMAAFKVCSMLTPLSIAKYSFTHQFPRPILLASQHSFAQATESKPSQGASLQGAYRPLPLKSLGSHAFQTQGHHELGLWDSSTLPWAQGQAAFGGQFRLCWVLSFLHSGQPPGHYCYHIQRK